MISKINKTINYDLNHYINHYGWWHGVRNLFNNKFSWFFRKKDIKKMLTLKSLLKKKNIVILTSSHCLFVAYLLANNLKKMSFNVIISDQYSSQNQDILHIVFAIQCYRVLPKYFIAYQVEQMNSSRWINNSKYIRGLAKSLIIFEYAKYNIEYLTQRNIGLQYIYFMPVSYSNDYRSQYNLAPYQWTDKTYDLCFYGDINNVRRKTFIEYISKHYEVLVLFEVFGKDLVTSLSKTKIVLNIHYYDNPLLETTRIYECLSLDVLVISERSLDDHYHQELFDIVDFVETDNKEDMLLRVDFWLKNPELLSQKIMSNRKKLEQLKHNISNQYLKRFLAAYQIGKIDDDQLLAQTVNLEDNYHQSNREQFYCLSITETPLRKLEFLKQSQLNSSNYNIVFCDGVKHIIGWVGAGMSFQYLVSLAIKQKSDMLIVCEDDAVFSDDFDNRIKTVLTYLRANPLLWDIYSGMMVECVDGTKIIDIKHFQGEDFIFVNKIISMVFNIYNKSSFDTIMQWQEPSVHSQLPNQTIDEYIRSSDLRFVLSYPFLVTHKQDANSTLWGGTKNCLLYDYRFNHTLSKMKQLIDKFKGTHSNEIL